MRTRTFMPLRQVVLMLCISVCSLAHAEHARLDEEVRDILSFALDSDQVLFGEERMLRVDAEATLADVGYRYGIGFRELTLANSHVDAWLPTNGAMVLLPTRFLLPDAPREGIVLNSAEMRMYYFPTSLEGVVVTFPVSVGRGNWQTPIGTTTLASKVQWPAWYPPKSIREEYGEDRVPSVVPPGPDNPLGEFALDLALPGYLIHGTNRPYGIGMPVTHGCIRLHPNDIRYLFRNVQKGTSVTLVHQPYKVGWQDGVLYLEVHPPIDGSDIDLGNVNQTVAAKVENVPDAWVNWNYVRIVAENPDGLPHQIGRKAATGEVATR